MTILFKGLLHSFDDLMTVISDITSRHFFDYPKLLVSIKTRTEFTNGVIHYRLLITDNKVKVRKYDKL